MLQKNEEAASEIWGCVFFFLNDQLLLFIGGPSLKSTKKKQ